MCPSGKITGAQWASQRSCLIDVGRAMVKSPNTNDPMHNFASDLEVWHILYEPCTPDALNCACFSHSNETHSKITRTPVAFVTENAN